MMDQLSWYLFYPEIALLTMACAVTLVDLTVTSARRTTTYLCSLLTLAVVAVMQFFYAYSGSVAYAFDRLAISDPMGNWLKLFSTLAVMVCLVYGRVYAANREMLRGGEWFSLSLFALLGILTMISANNLLIVYLGLELLTLSSYALVALRRENGQAIEAAMKYFVLGAMASGFLLYGMSMIYGATGALNIDQIALVLNTGVAEQRQLALVLGLVFVVAGLAFKFGVVPFHMWIPDVYQGAPTAVTLFVGTAPKLAAFAIAMRLLVEGLKPLAWDWQQMLGLLAIASLLVGNLAAIAQTNIKRMLAYSTISHMGFVFLGLLAGVVAGGGLAQMEYAYGAAMFYTVTYVLTSLAGFGIVLILSRQGFESENISDFAGLNRRRPFYAAIMALVMLSMAGIPPLVGFYAKLAVLQALVATGQAVYIGLAVFAVIMSLIGAFYYIRVIKVMYFDESPAGPQFVETGCATAPEAQVVLAVNGLLLLLLGILPGALMALCSGSIQVLLLRLL